MNTQALEFRVKDYYQDLHINPDGTCPCIRQEFDYSHQQRPPSETLAPQHPMQFGYNMSGGDQIHFHGRSEDEISACHYKFADGSYSNDIDGYRSSIMDFNLNNMGFEKFHADNSIVPNAQKQHEAGLREISRAIMKAQKGIYDV
jgi:hypothetical protein